MVKGISRQVIMVHSPDPKLFEQAIFILKEDAAQNGVTDEALLKEAVSTVLGSASCIIMAPSGPELERWQLG